MSSRMRPFVVINKTNTSAPLDHSAAVELADVDKGFLPNRLSTAQRDAIADPAPGLLIYNTDDTAYQFYDGSQWNAIGGGSNSGMVLLASGTITTPVAYFDLTLPEEYASYRLDLDTITFSTGDLIGFAVSLDGGVTFPCDTTNFDTFAVASNHNVIGQFGVYSPADITLLAWDSLIDFPGLAVDTNTNDVSMSISPGDGEFNFRICGTMVFVGVRATIPVFGRSAAAFTFNPTATVPPPSGRINLIRILPYGNGDCNPPTSGETIVAGSYILWGIAP